jgi:Ion channel
MFEYTLSFIRFLIGDLELAAPLLAGLLAAILVFGYVIGRLEKWSTLDGLYHAIIAGTTVGYGDFRPTRPVTKILTIILTFIGLIFTGIFVAICLHAAQITFGHLGKNINNYDLHAPKDHNLSPPGRNP